MGLGVGVQDVLHREAGLSLVLPSNPLDWGVEPENNLQGCLAHDVPTGPACPGSVEWDDGLALRERGCLLGPIQWVTPGSISLRLLVADAPLALPVITSLSSPF